MLTDKEKLDIIRNQADINPDDLNPEQYDFFMKSWQDFTEREKDLHCQVWETHPNTIEYAAKNICSKEEIITTADTLQKIRQSMIAGGANPIEFDDLEAGSLLESITRRAKQCRS